MDAAWEAFLKSIRLALLDGEQRGTHWLNVGGFENEENGAAICVLVNTEGLSARVMNEIQKRFMALTASVVRPAIARRA